MLRDYMTIMCSHSTSRQIISKLKTKPYEVIPGPQGQGWPLIGHLDLYLKKPNGYKKGWKNILAMKQKFLKPEDKLMKLHLPNFNGEHKGRVVVLFDPKDIELVYRNEGKYPYRYF